MNDHRFAVDLDDAAGGPTHAENQLRQLRAAGADQTGQTDDFPGPYHQTAGFHFTAVGQILYPQARLTGRNIALFIEQVA